MVTAAIYKVTIRDQRSIADY